MSTSKLSPLGSGVARRRGVACKPEVNHSPLPKPAIELPQPSKWAEREARLWLQDLGIIIPPQEELLDLLQNPFRNGIVLGEVALRLTGKF